MNITAHGQVTIHYQDRTGFTHAKTLYLAPIQSTIVQMITLGCVVQAEKTKAGRLDHLNGKNVVTIGRYQCATDVKTRRYAVYIGNDKTEFLSPIEAARFFIDWCGTRIAREAVRDYARKH